MANGSQPGAGSGNAISGRFGVATLDEGVSGDQGQADVAVDAIEVFAQIAQEIESATEDALKRVEDEYQKSLEEHLYPARQGAIDGINGKALIASMEIGRRTGVAIETIDKAASDAVARIEAEVGCEGEDGVDGFNNEGENPDRTSDPPRGEIP